MAAPQIPNLNTLRRTPGHPLGRARAGPSSSSNEEDEAAKNKIVQQTDHDASVSRLSAVQVGYLDDPFAELFVTGQGQRRFPIINRGPLLFLGLRAHLTRKFRYLRPHYDNRQPSPPFPLSFSVAEASHLPRRRLRHSLLPPNIAFTSFSIFPLP